MKKTIFGFGLLVVAATGLLLAQDIRKPVFAGQFYEGDPGRLANQINGFLGAADVKPDPGLRVLALIEPHAGYVYSGPTAAYGYKFVQGRDIDSVIIIGPSHRYGFEGGSVWPKGGFETPLGTAAVDESLAAEFMHETGYRFIPQAFAEEHSVEVQVPFLQTVLPQAKIVPVVLGSLDERGVRSLGSDLAKFMARPRVLVVASTDMSHYLPKAEANKVDGQTISLIRGFRAEALIRKLADGENILCGGAGVAAVLLAAQKAGASEARLLRYADSSETGTPADAVVGYMAGAVVAGERTPEFSLSSDEKKELLKLARSAVESWVRTGQVPDYQTQDQNLLAPRGAFVTLKERGELRGCIGFIEPVFPLARAVLQAAVYAASEDPRFSAVEAHELGSLEYEISVLTPLRRIQDPKEVRVGAHGLVIARGGQRGLLLPQVPVEEGWDRETFLRQACYKAGLPEDAWKTGAEIYVFEAIVFR
jgi:AmmeMemoRadiSam system protein B/AmmeMemoRadiSam system protein A